MNSRKIYSIGAKLGLKHKDIRDILFQKTMSEIPYNPVTPCSPMDTYKNDGTWYGTISINDF